MSIVCKNATNSTLICSNVAAVDYEVNLAFTILSMLTFVIVSVILFYYYHGDEKSYGTAVNMSILFFATIVTILSEISYQESQITPYAISNTTVIWTFGIGITFFTPFFFFKVPNTTGVKMLGHGHENIADFIWNITKCIIFMELFLIIGSLYEHEHLSAVLILSGTIQKLLQAILYKFILQYRVPVENKFIGASWYLKIVALFNFALWLESIMVADEQGTKFIKTILHDSYSIFSAAYAALLIDYRLLCCILFAEHALTLKQRYQQQRPRDNEQARSFSPEANIELDSVASIEKFKGDTRLLSACGQLFGMLLVGLQIANGFQYSSLGPWTNIFAMLAEIVTAVFGTVLLVQVRRYVKSIKVEHNMLSVGIDSLIIAMGVFAMLFWYLKGVITLVWAARSSMISNNAVQLRYLYWNGIKFCFRPFSLVFQIYLFMHSNVKLVCQKDIISRRINHFIIPVIMMSFLCVFISSIIDAYSGYIENLVKEAKINTVFLTLYKCGPPLHLGFCIHMFLQFHIINGKLAVYRKTAIASDDPRPTTGTNNIHNAGDDDDTYDDKRTPLLQGISSDTRSGEGVPNTHGKRTPKLHLVSCSASYEKHVDTSKE